MLDFTINLIMMLRIIDPYLDCRNTVQVHIQMDTADLGAELRRKSWCDEKIEELVLETTVVSNNGLMREDK